MQGALSLDVLKALELFEKSCHTDLQADNSLLVVGLEQGLLPLPEAPDYLGGSLGGLALVYEEPSAWHDPCLDSLGQATFMTRIGTTPVSPSRRTKQ